MGGNQNLLYIYGNDEYAISRRLREFAAMFADRAEAEMNTARLDARTMSEDQWMNAANAAPFLSARRLVLLANPSARFARSRSRSASPDETEGEQPVEPGRGAASSEGSTAEARRKFLLSLERLAPTTTLVMWEPTEIRYPWDKARQEQEDSRHWLIKWMKEHDGGVERHALPGEKEMPAWILKHAREQGGELAVPAAAVLADMVGSDTRQAAQEVTKLLAYANWSRPVTAADVEALSPVTAAPDVFKMVDALAARQASTAQRLLHRLLDSRDAFSTWGMIIRQFRLLLLAREVLDSGGGEKEALVALGAQPFVARKALGQARAFSMPRLEGIYHRLLEIDEAAKTGQTPLDVSLDLLIAELAG